MQKYSEIAVRTEVGKRLDQLMGSSIAFILSRSDSSAARSGIA